MRRAESYGKAMARGVRRRLSPKQGPGRALSLVAAFLVAEAFGAAAQESGTDDFDPFAEGAFAAEAEAAAAARSGSSQAGNAVARTEFLAGGTFSVSSTAYAPADFDGYAALSSISGKVFAKVSVPDYGSLFASYVVTQDFFAGLSGNGPATPTTGADLDSPSYALSELHYSFDLGKKVFVRLGKQLIAWGPSQVWTPVDFVNPDKEDFFSSLDLREGKAGLRVHVPLPKANVFVFSDFSGLVDGGAVRDPATAVNYAARLDVTLAGYELGLTGFWGPRARAKGGLDFSGSLFGAAVYGELAAGPAYSGYERFAMASLGFSRTLGDLKKWTVSAEGFYNSEGTDLTTAMADGDYDVLYVGAWYAYAAVKGADFPARDIESTLYALANLTDGSFQVALSGSFEIPRLVPFTLILSYMGGEAWTELAALTGGPAFQITARTRIAF